MGEAIAAHHLEALVAITTLSFVLCDEAFLPTNRTLVVAVNRHMLFLGQWEKAAHTFEFEVSFLEHVVIPIWFSFIPRVNQLVQPVGMKAVVEQF